MKKLNAMSRKDHKVAEKSAKNPVEKSAENANTVAKTLAKVGEKSTNESPCLDSQVFSTRTGKGDKEKMANTQVRTKGPKVDKKQPKKVSASKLRAKEEADQSRAKINTLPEMAECVIDDWYWSSDERTELTLDAADRFADAVQQMHNGDPTLYLELYKDEDMRPLLDVLTNLQAAHQVLVCCEKKAKAACLRLLNEYTEYPREFASKKSFNPDAKHVVMLGNPRAVGALPKALRDRIRNAAVGIKVGKMSETENELVKIVKDAFAANELFDLILSLQWPVAIEDLLLLHPEFNEFGDHGEKLKA